MEMAPRNHRCLSKKGGNLVWESSLEVLSKHELICCVFHFPFFAVFACAPLPYSCLSVSFLRALVCFVVCECE